MTRLYRSLPLLLVSAGFVLAASPSQGQTPSPDRVRASIGKSVAITEQDGTRHKGRLASLSTTEVVVSRDGRDVKLPLADVRRVERTSYAIRNGIIIGVIGAAGALGISCAIERCPAALTTEFFPDTALVLAVGAGAGAGLGWLFRGSAASRTIFEAPSKATITIAPAVGKQRAGIQTTISWR